MTFITQPDCSSCERAEAIIERMAADFSIRVLRLQFQSERGRQIAEEWAAMFPPVILIDGNLFSQARLSEKDLRKELQTRQASPE